MSAEGLAQAQDKMAREGICQEAIDVFSHYYRELEGGATGLIPESSIDPLPRPPHLTDIDIDDHEARAALDRTVVLKLNGGLATSMGMSRAKSLLEVSDGRSFLDLICAQVRHARQEYGARLPLLFMNSFRTSADTLEAMKAHPDIAYDGLPLDFVQNSEPKLRADDLTPVTWPDDPELEWCPPGHGDLYTALLATGILEKLIDMGFRYATVSNSDNLGATPDPRIAGWFAASGAPYAAEVCRRTVGDRKGGHLAVRKADGRLVLRETAQTSDEDMVHFTDEKVHAFVNTNNLWFDLEQLLDVLRSRDGVLGLPLIRNAKTVDPADPSSPKVYQIESAMGAAVEIFDGAQAIEVDRTRFLPVKTTNDLLLMRSDAYRVAGNGTVARVSACIPTVNLDDRYYRRITDFEERFPHGSPSLKETVSLTVRGDWSFGAGVSCVGEVSLAEHDEPQSIPDGAVLR
ncbi:UTP--glucose-1-phosphate uridylyltransferase [Austwickia chelonae]|uniref:Putative UTP--glucose-1-phosphate uridylyltransferase n=1 Tax=Austwickia chelonae NBRC 105200 TaxID=1184607 RepID=K6VVJ2_9MICO|nr:UTP--glucose-1-phosphate uridylyltransferase [Austwickia chelonae]GAB79365.1 putative UTP--glucose-1-phosphate uridylyltransferase [Austwickia chelonae NBRC 105200]SEW43857.1 UTP--glucose-1-phosphate uridylyltransferase [Austwickia chelonae]